jgi:hypothetical protein
MTPHERILRGVGPGTRRLLDVLYSEIVRREEAKRVYCGECAGQGWVMQPERVEGGGVRGVYRTCARCKGTGWACG